jgi:hypothetical protein
MDFSLYPGIRATAMFIRQHISVQTNSQDDWAISIRAIKGDALKLIFDSIDDEKIIGSKTWKIE